MASMTFRALLVIAILPEDMACVADLTMVLRTRRLNLKEDTSVNTFIVIDNVGIRSDVSTDNSKGSQE